MVVAAVDAMVDQCVTSVLVRSVSAQHTKG